MNYRWDHLLPSIVQRAKRVVPLMLLLLVAAGCDSDQFIIPPAEETMQVMSSLNLQCTGSSPTAIVIVDGSRLRTGPGTSHGALGLTYRGIQFAIRDVSDDGEWVELANDDGQSVWIHYELITVRCV